MNVFTASFVRVLAIVSIVGCGKCQSSDTLIVNVRTDLSSGVDFDSATVCDASGACVERAASPRENWGVPTYIGEFEGLRSPARLEIALRLRGSLVVSRRATIELRRTTSTTVVLERVCSDVRCEADEACYAGMCVDARCIAGTEEGCPRPGCEADADCDTSDVQCVEAECIGGRCIVLPDSSECDTMSFCSVETGCTPIPSAPDASVADAGTDAYVPIPGDSRCVDTDSSHLLCESFEDGTWGDNWSVGDVRPTITSNGARGTGALECSRTADEPRSFIVSTFGDHESVWITGLFRRPDANSFTRLFQLWNPRDSRFGIIALSVDEAGNLLFQTRGLQRSDGSNFSVGHDFGSWTCVEMRLESNLVEVFVEGRLAIALLEPAGSFEFESGRAERIELGCLQPGSNERGLYDELVVSTGRVGCGR